MRDPNRIPKVCGKLKNLWMDEVPDWRLCQLMVNFLSWIHSQGTDPFFVEDEEMCSLLEEFLHHNC